MCNVVLKNNTECFYSDYAELICDVVAENIPVFILNFDFLFFSFQCGLTSFVMLHSYFMTVSEVFLELIDLLRPFQRCFGS